MKDIFSELEPLIKDDEASREEFRMIANREQQNQIQQNKRMKTRARVVAILIAISSLISVVFFVYAITQKVQLETLKDQIEQKNNIGEN